ncbi:hypothetical protein [Nitratifractor sp.]
MKKLLALLLFLLLGVAALLSPPGQKILLLPYINKLLSEKVPDHRVRLTALDAGFSTLSFDGTLDGTIRFHAEGPVSWSERSFDLRYRAEGKELTLQGRSVPLQLSLAGRVKGRIGSMEVEGRGELADSPLEYRFHLADSELSDLHLSMKGGELSQLLALAGLPPYARGRLRLTADLPRPEAKHPQGTLRFRVTEGELDAASLKKAGIALPDKRSFTASGEFRLKGRLLKGDATMTTPLGSLRVMNFRADPGLRVIKSDFTLSVRDLAALRSLLHAPLSGALKAEGIFYFDRMKKHLQLLTRSGSFGGELKAFYDDGKGLKLSMKGLELPRLLAVVGERPWLRQGTLDGTIRLRDLKKLTGNFDLRARGRWNRTLLPPATFGSLADAPFDLGIRGAASDGKLRGTGEYRTEFGSLHLKGWNYTLLGGVFRSPYRLEIPDLSRLSLPRETKLRGSFSLAGKIAYLGMKKRLSLEGISSSFGGESRLRYDGKSLKLTMEKVDPTRLLQVLGQPRILGKGSLNARLDLRDLPRQNGSYSLDLSGTLDRSFLRRQFGRDPGRGIPMKFGSRGTIRQGTLRGEGLLDSELGSLTLKRLRYQNAMKRVDGSYRLNIPDLGKWKPLTGRAYRGSLAFGGYLAYGKKGLQLDGKGEQWGGVFSFQLRRGMLDARAARLRVGSLLETLAYAKLLSGVGKASLHYDMKRRKGKFDGRIDGARLMPSPVTQAASLLLKTDLSAVRFDPVLLRARITGDLAKFDLDARSPRIRLRSEKGSYDLAGEKIDTILAIEKGTKIYKIKVYGAITHPRVAPIMTDAIRQKLEHEIKKYKLDKKIEKAIPKELRKSLPVEDLIHSFF